MVIVPLVVVIVSAFFGGDQNPSWLASGEMSRSQKVTARCCLHLSLRAQHRFPPLLVTLVLPKTFAVTELISISFRTWICHRYVSESDSA